MEKIKKLIRKLFSGTISQEELNELNNWYRETGEIEEIEVFTDEILEKEQLKKEMYIKLKEELKLKPEKNGSRFYIKFSIAALLVLSLTYLLYTVDIFNYPNRVKDDFIVKATPKGKKSKIVLLDGTKIWLNSGSKVKIRKNTDENRMVYLKGEAFFEVAKNPDKPFIVKTGEISTTVLGTSFNVKKFKNDIPAITVVTGKVRVENKKNNLVEFLLPGEQVTYNKKEKRFIKRNVDIEKFISWKDGVLIFDNITLKAAADLLSREFDVNVIIKDEKLSKKKIHAKYKNEKLTNILRSLHYALNIDYTFNNRTVVFY